MMNYRFSFFLLIFLAGMSSTFAQEIQWAGSVVDVSSNFQYAKAPQQYQAKHILGPPSILPGYGASPAAWCPFSETSTEGEWIKVGFADPQPASRVLINESFNPGSIVKITAYGEDRKVKVIYQNSRVRSADPKGEIFDHSFEETPFPVTMLRIDMKTLDVPGFNQLDCVGLTTSDAPVETWFRINLKSQNEGLKRENLGKMVNSEHTELLPVISPDEKSLYFTRQDHPGNIAPKTQEIWRSEVLEDGSFGEAENLGRPLNNESNSSLTSISPDGNTALLLNEYLPDGGMDIGISYTRRVGDKFEFPTKLEIKDFYNDSNYGEYCLASDGRTLIMCVQRKNGVGGKDMYVSFLNEDSTWTAPKSLGATVNTGDSEVGPFLAADGKTLYFATAGLPGFGKKDMFKSTRLDDSWTNWTTPENLGPVLNTPGFDAYYTIPASGDYVYFSSYDNAIGESDIFRIRLSEELKPDPVVLVYGKVLNAKTGDPLEADIVYESFNLNRELGSTHSNPETGDYSIVLPQGDAYGFLASANGFASENQNLDLNEIGEYRKVRMDLKLVPIEAGQTVRLNNVFFDYDKYSLRPAASLELARVLKLMNQYPSMKVEIAGHTDDRGGDAYNLNLSQKRAQTVVEYLKDAGIEGKRIQAKGYGETAPVMSNETDEGRQMNRRVELRILSLD